MSNRVDPDETAHVNLCCLQKPINIAYGSKRVNADNVNFNQKLHSAASDLSALFANYPFEGFLTKMG